jgi:hypothetical protein
MVNSRKGEERRWERTFRAERDRSVEKADIVLTVDIEDVDLGQLLDVLNGENNFVHGEGGGVEEDGAVVYCDREGQRRAGEGREAKPTEHPEFALLESVESILFRVEQKKMSLQCQSRFLEG